jgi:PRTRC genetic system protein A
MKPTEADKFLQAHTPVVMVPRFGEYVPLQENGHRFLAAADGLWMEVRRPWCHIVWPVCQQAGVSMPYGKLDKKVWMAFGQLPTWAVERFQLDAKKHWPNEVGAVVTWNERTGEMAYLPCEVIESGVGRLKQKWPPLGEGVWPVLDIHSHGPIKAFFSGTDRDDTRSDVVVAAVLGEVTEVRPELVVSLFAMGVEIRSSLPEALRVAFRPGLSQEQGQQDEFMGSVGEYQEGAFA